MESQVFGYFLSIGAGLAFGLSLGAAPAYLLCYKFGKGGKRNDKIAKARA